MKQTLKSSLIIILVFVTAPSLFGQQNWGEDGEIEAAEIIIEKDRLIELPAANRSFEKVSPPPVENSNGNTLLYDFKTFNYQMREFDPKIRVLTIKDEAKENPGGNYIKGGIGNYVTPYLETFIGNRKSNSYNYGLHMRHLSSATGPVDGKNSGSSDNNIRAYSSFFLDKAVLKTEVNYDRTMRHFYGYAPGTDVNRSDIKQIYNSLNLLAGIQSLYAERNAYHLNLNYNHISDRYDMAENTFIGDFDIRLKGDDYLKLGVSSDIYISQYRSGENLNRNMVRMTPYSLFEMDKLKVKAGLNVVVDYSEASETEQEKGKFHVYPLISADYELSNSLNVFAGLDGDMHFNSLQEFAGENPFMAPGSRLLNTNKLYNLSLGFKGRVSSLISYESGINYGTFKNMHFFVNGLSDSTRMDIVYNTDKSSLFNFYGEVSMQVKSVFRSSLRADYFNYNISGFDHAWHRPDYKISFSNSYNVSNKIIFSSDLYWIGGLKGYNLQSEASTDLKDIVDLNFKVDYVFTNKVTSFVNFNNILAQKYERYWNYPSRGLIIMAGLTYSF